MRAIHQRKAGLVPTDLLSAQSASPGAKFSFWSSPLLPFPLLVAHGIPPGYWRGSARAARARASASERHGSCFDCGPRAVPRMPPVVTLPNLRAARGCPFASPPRPAARNDPQWGAAGGGAGASGVTALTRGLRAARSLVPLAAGKVPVYCVVAEFVGVFLFQFIGGGADANSISTGRCPRCPAVSCHAPRHVSSDPA